ncbi:MAG: hypothetical protein KDD43_16200, partial [Bdellovibrionales bacterium]|nr:hypothetical protein [Bdellovibrionales bacterium]
DPEGCDITYSWEQVAGDYDATISDSTSATPTISMPDENVSSTVQLKLTVTDYSGKSSNETYTFSYEPDPTLNFDSGLYSGLSSSLKTGVKGASSATITNTSLPSGGGAVDDPLVYNTLTLVGNITSSTSAAFIRCDNLDVSSLTSLDVSGDNGSSSDGGDGATGGGGGASDNGGSTAQVGGDGGSSSSQNGDDGGGILPGSGGLADFTHTTSLSTFTLPTSGAGGDGESSTAAGGSGGTAGKGFGGGGGGGGSDTSGLTSGGGGAGGGMIYIVCNSITGTAPANSFLANGGDGATSNGISGGGGGGGVIIFAFGTYSGNLNGSASAVGGTGPGGAQDGGDGFPLIYDLTDDQYGTAGQNFSDSWAPSP